LLSRFLVGLLVALGCAATLAFAAPAVADVVTNANDYLRTGWYPGEGSITPGLVSGSTWGQLWSSPVDGQVYAQPLLAPSGTLIVSTETDHVYGLNPATGDAKWTDNLAANGPWNPADNGCSDIVPWRGSTSTPVIDTSTNTVYMTHKTYDDANHDHAVWYMDALDINTGQELPGWPVQLGGTGDNHPSTTFDAEDQDQRAGLLLVNGVVYAGFGSTCDAAPFEGWVFGVSTAGHVTARWVSVTGYFGGGVWQAGVGLSSDSPGSILLATGNGGAPTTPAPGTSPPASCGECVIRLQVQPDGTLAPVDFFAPFDAAQLDQFDSDFGSGGVVGLPDQYFGTASVPHLAIAAGKEGYVYLLNRDHLGGYEQATGGGDDVVQRLGSFGAVFGRPGVWPGDGGYVYIPTSSGPDNGGELDVYQYGTTASGDPSLAQVAHSSDVFGFGSGSPVITSDGTTSGSALVWIIWSANRNGDGGQLRAYDPVPVNGAPVLRWSASIGSATNYSTPGVGAGRLYVGTRDGRVIAFGSPVSSPLSGSGLTFPRTTIGSANPPQETLTMTANRSLSVTNIVSSDPGEFSVGPPSQSLPAQLSAGQTISVAVTFSPGHTGPVAAHLTASTTDTDNKSADVPFSLSGTGQVNGPKLAASTPVLSLGGTSVGGHLTGSVVFSNVGSQALTIQGVEPPSAPFSSPDAPAANATIAPGASITVDVSFDPTSPGSFTPDTYKLGLESTGGNVSVGLSASAGTPGNLEFSSEAIDFGSTQVGTTATQSFTITNTGGTTVTIEKSKPPFGGDFAATTSLPEGTTIPAGRSVTETVAFTPTSTGPASGVWQINGNDGTGLHPVQFTGTGASAPVGGPSSAPPAGSPAQGSGSPTAASVKTPGAPKLNGSIANTRTVSGVYISYNALTAGVSRFVLERVTVGRRSGRGCVAVSARNRSNARCTLYVVVARFTHRDRVGSNKLRLGAYVTLRKLQAGRYRLQSTLLDTAGNEHTFNAALRIILAPPVLHAGRAAVGWAPLEGLLARLTSLI